jgi:hypothetical protein
MQDDEKPIELIRLEPSHQDRVLEALRDSMNRHVRDLVYAGPRREDLARVFVTADPPPPPPLNPAQVLEAARRVIGRVFAVAPGELEPPDPRPRRRNYPTRRAFLADFRPWQQRNGA